MDFLKRLFGGDSGSSQRAKDRLRIVLIHDRTDISPRLLDDLRRDMIAVLTKYMEIDTDKIELDLDRDDMSTALVANIPVLRIKRSAALPEDDEDEAASRRIGRRQRNEHKRR